MVEFSWDYNIENWTEADYRAFIRRLIKKLGVTSSHNRPALAFQQNPPTSFFDLVLRTNDRSVRFRFRNDNLYLIGYQMLDDQWLEFGKDGDQHLITEPGTNFLGFEGNYDRLATAGNRILQKTRVGFLNLVSAINQLAVTTDMEARARNLVVVIMMISEATRFIPILDHLAPSFRPQKIGDREFSIPVWIENLVKSWKKLSIAVWLGDADPCHNVTLPENNYVVVQPGSRTIRTIVDILEILGIMLGHCFRPRRSKRKRRLTSGSDDDDDGQCFIGLPFVQVFSVQINNIEDENPGELYGTIILDDGLRTDFIYNRTRSNYESIRPGQYATLIGPSQAVSAIGDFTIKLLLADKVDPGSWFDDVIMNEVISWDSANLNAVYDQLISKQLHSSRGSVTVNYAVMRNAAAARITIILQEGGESTVEVYGHVSASYTYWVDPKMTSVLFERTSGDYVSVNRGEEIPLSRSVVAVPLKDSLKVTALLYDKDSISSDVIANGIVEFPVPQTIPSTSHNSIPGEGNNNFVRVAVQWSYGYF